MTIYSMTGYGSIQVSDRDWEYFIEIKSVNNKYLKIGSRFPEIFNPLQFELEGLAKKCISRGSVHLQIRGTSNGEEDGSCKISEKTLKNYGQQIRQLSPSLGFPIEMTLADALQLPGVVVPREQPLNLTGELTEKILEAFQKVLDQVLAMREKEGAQLVEELDKYLDNIRSVLSKIEERVPLFLKEYQEKLLGRVRTLIQEESISLEPGDLIRELAVYADKTDISEEIVRLDSHLKQFADTLTKGGAVGRKLDFLTQEMLREANTMGSKTSDLKSLNHIVDIKSLVDKIKEQVQNIE